MQLLHNLSELSTLERPVCMAIGVFDGVHQGHQAVILRAVSEARQHNGVSVVLTFDPHPMRVTRPQDSPLLLTSTAHKLRLIESFGVDATLICPFTTDFSRVPPDEFILSIHSHCRKLQEICVGHRWVFGYKRAGNIELIARLASTHHFAVKGMEPIAVDGDIVSSTLIRQCIASGDLPRASRLLGRAYSILGEVVPGRKIGRTLGFPTANLAAHAEIFPPDGVYAARVWHQGTLHPAAVNIGVRPTLSDGVSERLMEVHLLDFTGDLYGQTLDVVFVAKIRDELKFSSPEALREQIVADVEKTRQILARTHS